jgi:phosphate/sulfate permease
MENFYLIIVVVLLALAISDLIVGVSNDAGNFLNAAFGSKAAPKWLIFLMAGVGVFIGTTFSSGMMEIARKGIFHPEMFVFNEIMVIFTAVMITDILLLNTFNSLRMPTSTTVSIVFELLGAAVAVSLVKLNRMGGTVGELSNYINSEKALAIISGILLSVPIAFTIGSIVQYITRIIFTFNYRKNMKYLGAVYGGLAITAITYFLLIKGIAGASFAQAELRNGEIIGDWIIANNGKLLLYGFLGWVVIIQILNSFFKVKILKLTVLIGTFALAMAFAGNDLVNFIGVPIAGLYAFKTWTTAGAPLPETFPMEFLAGKADTPSYILLIAGLIMILTLTFSKKAHSVVYTSVDLARQSEGDERFSSSMLARVIVRNFRKYQKKLVAKIPEPLIKKIQARFKPVSEDYAGNSAFDKIRATVNLFVASVLIAIGTSYKLPLSTTYVTFMVAMGTSFADRAWGLDSAVYRISGVLAVVGGWFLTAIIAFSVTAIIAWIIFASGMFMIFVFAAIAIFMLLQTHFGILKKNGNGDAIENLEDEVISEKDGIDKVMQKCRNQVIKAIIQANKVYSESITNFLNEERSDLKEALKLKDDLNKRAKKQKNKVLNVISKIEKNVDSGHFYVQVVDYQRELAHSLNFLVEPLYEHVNNNHRPFNKSQIKEMQKLRKNIDSFYISFIELVEHNNFDEIPDLIIQRDEILETLENFEIMQIRRIKAGEVNTRNSVLFFNIISETKNMLLHSINLIKAHRDFILESQQMAKKKGY